MATKNCARLSFQDGKNRPYFLTGRWAAAWAKFGSTFFPHIFVWGSCFWFCIPPPPFLVAIVARQEIRSIFVKNKAYFGKNRPYFLTGRWAAAWAKFGSTFFPHIFVWGSCFWFCIPPPPFLVATVARQEIRSIFAKISLIFDKNRPYFLTGNDGNQKLVHACP